MKALFITGTINDNGGGCVIANRNKQLLYQLLGKTNVEIFKVCYRTMCFRLCSRDEW